MAVVTIYLVRHGESEGNAAHRVLGHTDLGLTELGRRQAEATAEALKDVHLDAIYSSDLKRAMSTAEPHGRIRGMKVIPDHELREIHCGAWENRLVEDIIKEDEINYVLNWRGVFGNFQMPSGESVPHAAERFKSEIFKLAEKHPNQQILIAAHAGVIRAFWALKVLGIPKKEVGRTLPFPNNASYSVIKVEGDKITPISYSNDEHLQKSGLFVKQK